MNYRRRQPGHTAIRGMINNVQFKKVEVKSLFNICFFTVVWTAFAEDGERKELQF